MVRFATPLTILAALFVALSFLWVSSTPQSSNLRTDVSFPQNGPLLYAVFLHHGDGPEVEPYQTEFRRLAEKYSGQAHFIDVDTSKENWPKSIPEIVKITLEIDLSTQAHSRAPEFTTLKYTVKQGVWYPNFSKLHGVRLPDTSVMETTFLSVQRFTLEK